MHFGKGCYGTKGSFSSVQQGCPLNAFFYFIATHPMLQYMDHLVDTRALLGQEIHVDRPFIAQDYVDDFFLLASER